MLSTMQPHLGTAKDGRQPKPALYKLYDYTKGGTDIIDQHLGLYSFKSISPNWTITPLSSVFDTCRVKPSNVLAMNLGHNPRAQDSFQFGWNLAMKLIVPFLKASPLNGLRFST